MAAAPGKRIVVIGGGMAGLSYVYYLRNFVSKLNKTESISKITLIEANNYLGGSIKTSTFDDGIIHELGPRGIRCAGYKSANTLALIDRIGLADRLLPVTKTSASNNRYIYKDGNFAKAPSSIKDLFSKLPYCDSTLFSCLIKDFKTPRYPAEQNPYQDPPLYDYISYRFGEEVADNIICPLLRGITAGDARKLSTKSLFGDVFTHEQVHGGLVRSLLKPAQIRRVHDELFTDEVLECDTAEKYQRDGVKSFNLSIGLQSIPECLGDLLLNENTDEIVDIHTETKVKSIRFNQDSSCGVTVETMDNDKLEIEADHIVSAIPSNHLKDLIPESSREALKNITDIEHKPVGCVVVEYRNVEGQLPPVTQSFGFLTHPKTDTRLLGISFDSCMFPQIDQEHKSFRMTCMMGGAWWEEVFKTNDINQVTDTLMEQISLEEIRSLLKIKAEPHRMSSLMWKTGIAQYTCGHQDRLMEAKKNIENLKLPLTLIGQSYNGVSVPDIIYNSRKAAYEYYKTL